MRWSWGVIAIALGTLAARSLESADPALGGGQRVPCMARPGDVDADGTVNLTDAVVILTHLFLGSPSTLPRLCSPERGVTATGQTKCYGIDGLEVDCESADCRGQNGTYSGGCPFEDRFTDNGDGTVTDHCTGLMWQKDTADLDEDGEITNNDEALWCEALVYCEDLDFAGHDDWRLPNARELFSLVRFGQTAPVIDAVFTAVPRGYWSSTSVTVEPVAPPGYAWSAHFNVPRMTIKPKPGAIFGGLYVRAVRDAVGACVSKNGDTNADGAVDLADPLALLNHLFRGSPQVLPELCTSLAPARLPATDQRICYDEAGIAVPCEDTCPGQDATYRVGCPMENRFTFHGDGTVTDECTGLMWQVDDADVNGDGETNAEDTIPWCDAVSFCESLVFAGHDDWRAPDIRELESLEHYGTGEIAIDIALGRVVDRYNLWSSTSNTETPSAPTPPALAWAFGGVVIDWDKARTAGMRVRAVRNAR